MKRYPALIVLLLNGLLPLAFAHDDPPTGPPPSPMVDRLLDDPLTGDAERERLRVFHGRWDGFEPSSPDTAALLALLQHRLDDPALRSEGVDPLVRAEAALRIGRPSESLELLEDDASARASLIRARAFEALGDLQQAASALMPVRERLSVETIEDAAELTAAAEALVMLARLEGRPAQDYQMALGLLTKAHQELDPLYWPAMVAEADLLTSKDNRPEAAEALVEALRLNPHSGDAWYRLGVMASRGFDFDRAEAAAAQLRKIDEANVLADLLDARTRLVQRDAAGAREAARVVLAKYPTHREALALAVAAAALAYDDDALADAIARFDGVAPGNPMAHRIAGEYLALAKQYGASETMLREAVARAPNDSAARIELGLLLLQAGRNEEGQAELNRAARLDPFHRRVTNSLALMESLLEYETIETDHFIVRYRPGIDEVLARDMPGELGRIHDEISAVFEHEPTTKTQIDLLPDEKSFGVRITGMPDIWTIAAATGPVIALTPPREGAGQRGVFDWANVIRHEYVHTVNLDQTGNRVPHWFTEGAAVSQELTGRSFDNASLLAWALHEDKLFDYEDINWGFIRPQAEYERPLAYAQADWMLEFIAFKHGHRAIVEMLAMYREGVPDVEVIERVTGEPPDAFMADFRGWAAQQVDRWGLGPDQVEERAELKALAEQALASDDAEAAERAVLRYAKAVPVDPWPHRALAKLALEQGRGAEALASMEYLAQIEQADGRWAYRVATVHRAAGQPDAARHALRRGMHREPYNATYRELAATLALQTGDVDEALRQLESIAILEPDRATHQVRLAAIYAKLGQTEASHAAALRARELDPDAPVDRFLNAR